MNEINESIDENKELDPKEALLERHRLEKKQLNAKITQLRHSLTKGDKKKKKEINKEIDLLTEELQKRHENEVKNFETENDSSVHHLSNQMNNIGVNEDKVDLNEDTEPLPNGIKYNETKISKAQRKREAKALKQKQKEQQIKDDMIDDSLNIRLIEDHKINKLLSDRGMALYEIPSDGDCMYKAIEHQLSLKNITTTVPELRQKTCAFMKENKLDFLPFLTSPSTGDLMNDSEYDNYCNDIFNTKVWGGQLELRAVSHIFRFPIEVIQSDTSPVLIGQIDYKTRPLILCYHRHAYSLGEHYNSVEPLPRKQL